MEEKELSTTIKDATRIISEEELINTLLHTTAEEAKLSAIQFAPRHVQESLLPLLRAKINSTHETSVQDTERLKCLLKFIESKLPSLVEAEIADKLRCI